MKEKVNKLKTERKHLYNLLDSFNEKELYTIKKFAEFVDINKNNKDDKLLQILMDAPFDDEELSEKAIQGIKKARNDIKKGKTYSHSQIKKELGI